ncbi:putative Nbs-lrr resistance protein [Melia azedarach]|uniref:Nbs-lrr resistance protein n=1 Tax=Melia azedarach TaxID=155640 RepID=A0ACC1XWP9_MELAZ|nr:putative Nbs-lrr resistance protein [Melia azedarach]
MAEAILSDVVGRILGVLGSRAFQEIQLTKGVKDELLKLKDTVEIINGVLLDAEEQFNQKKNQAVAVWLRRLKDAVYDADDLLDDFNSQLKLKEMMSGSKMAKEVRIFFSNSNQIAYSLKMGRKIKAIRMRLDDIKNDKQFLLFKHDNGKGANYYNVSKREQTHSFVLEENVVGRDDDKNAILQLLLDSNGSDNVSVVSIVGIGGVGKTTLVQSIYNIEKVKTHFQLRIWVCVSDDFTAKSIVEKIIKSITRKEFEKLEMDQLQQFLREQIDGKRYLLVLDDIWNDNSSRWSDLQDLLRNGARGSKIVVTTRSERVANIMSSPPLIYVLRGLTEDKSWILFTKVAFELGKEPKDWSLVAIGKDIVAKCVGVPLAIRTIGRLLYRKSKEYWLIFRDQELSEIIQEEGDILPILKLSYDHLSSRLKQCFAYCALFPKDYIFEKENLIQLWMAQGFLSTSMKNQRLEDVGDEYFMDLLSGTFLQELKEEARFPQGRVMPCKMHVLMHDLAQSVVGRECKMITRCSYGDNVDERSRHISFDPNLNSLEISTTMLRAKHLRTILPLCSSGKLNKFHLNKILSNFRCLRSLNLSCLDIIEVPTSIGTLKHLRYLNLSWNKDIKELPNSVSKLINLQTLNLYKCIKLEKLPRDMRKMVHLRYLMIDDCDSLASMPRGLGQLTGLQTLVLFVVAKRDEENDALRELNGLNKLRGSLTIKVMGDKENVNLAEANLEEKQHLESITLEGNENEGYDKMTVEGLKPHPNLKKLHIYGLRSVMFAGCMSSFTNLIEIKISSCISFRNITPLDQLPSLLSLTLEYLHNVEYISESDTVPDGSTCTPPTTATTFFPSLKALAIYNCRKLKGWWKVNDDPATTTEKAELLSFPCLSQLYISYCPMLTCMPLYPTLEELILWKSNTKTLQQTMKMQQKTSADANAAAPSTSYSAFCSSPAFSNLKTLSLRLVDDLDSLPELLHRVTSLAEMDISYSPKLISQLPQCIRYLSSLEKLKVGGCEQPDLQFDDGDDCQWQGLRSLCYLEFYGVQNMMCLPEWIHHITTLQHLQIFLCNNLMGLPEGMQLEKLEFSLCAHLSERYGNDKDVEWPKIAHIPNIRIDGLWMQLEGLYQGDGE